MSFSATRWAWKQTASSRDKLVLLALADRSNDQGECWPSMARIAIDCGLSRHTVMRSVAKLRQLGLVETTQRKNKDGKSSLHYSLKMAPTRSIIPVADCYTPCSKLLQPL